jgi:hypothetical protein
MPAIPAHAPGPDTDPAVPAGRLAVPAGRPPVSAGAASTSAASTSAASTGAAGTPEMAGAVQQCGRCRLTFAAGSEYEPTAPREWWLCPDCRSALLGTGH